MTLIIDKLTQLNFNVIECGKCGVQFGISSNLHRTLTETRQGFYCPNGHSRYYPEDTEKNKLKREVKHLKNRVIVAGEQMEAAERDARTSEKRAAAHKGQVTKIKKRIKHGVCPCCNRTFKNLARHMSTKHKDYVDTK